MARGESWLSCRPLLLLCLHLCKLLRTDARRQVYSTTLLCSSTALLCSSTSLLCLHGCVLLRTYSWRKLDWLALLHLPLSLCLLLSCKLLLCHAWRNCLALTLHPRLLLLGNSRSRPLALLLLLRWWNPRGKALLLLGRRYTWGQSLPLPRLRLLYKLLSRGRSRLAHLLLELWWGLVELLLRLALDLLLLGWWWLIKLLLLRGLLIKLLWRWRLVYLLLLLGWLGLKLMLWGWRLVYLLLLLGWLGLKLLLCISLLLEILLILCWLSLL